MVTIIGGDSICRAPLENHVHLELVGQYKDKLEDMDNISLKKVAASRVSHLFLSNGLRIRAFRKKFSEQKNVIFPKTSKTTQL